MSWVSLGSLVDHFWELDDYQRLHGMRVIDVKLLDVDKTGKNAIIRKVTEKRDGRRCTGYVWGWELHGRWNYKCVTLDDARFWDRVLVPIINDLQIQMKREYDMIDNGRRLESWM